MILYELLCGRRPYVTPQGPVKDVLETMIQDRRFAPPSLAGRNNAVTPAIEAIIGHCLEADPAQRYQTARQLQEDLHRQLNDLPLLHIPEPSPSERCASGIDGIAKRCCAALSPPQSLSFSLWAA